MDEATLPERLRALADELEAEAEAWTRIIRDALREAAGELERLTRPPDREGLRALLGDLAELADRLTPARGRDWRAVALMARAELSRLDHLARWTLPESVGERLASGPPAPSIILPPGDGLTVTPRPRRFAARFASVQGQPWPTPAPGSFVHCGPALAVWRVLSVDELAGHMLPMPWAGEPVAATHALELEPVDPHDVPIQARMGDIPQPLDELDGDALYSEPADDDAVPCSAAYMPPLDVRDPMKPQAPVPCVRPRGHEGEHLFRWLGGEVALADDDGEATS